MSKIHVSTKTKEYIARISQNMYPKDKYEYLVFHRNVYKYDLIKALEIVKNYIIKKKLILTGGMAIDLALKKKGYKLYSEESIPDYDFYSHDFQNDAYNIGKLLCLEKLPNISVINAAHITTMRVRVDFEPVADITYIPKNVYDSIPTIKNKDGIIFEHPHYKLINMHRALSYPYAGHPFDVILQRYGKDMERYDMLYEAYPLDDLKKCSKNIKFKTVKIDKTLFRNQCLSGFAALDYWISLEKHISNSKTDFKKWKDKEIIDVKIPELARISILSNDPLKTKENVMKLFKTKVDFQNYNALLENIPNRIHVNILSKNTISGIDILDNRGELVAATKIKDFYVANIQFLMNVFLSKYILYNKDIYKCDKYIWGYMRCFELVKNASNNFTTLNSDNSKLLPVNTVFGTSNISKSGIILEHNILKNIGEMSKNYPSERPFNIHPSLKFDCEIPKHRVDKFDIAKSWIFNIDGEKNNNPLEFINS